MISVAIIAKDAAGFLPACLSSLKDLSDDIVVVIDDRTADNTKEIAGSFGAKTFVKNFTNFADQKNFAVSKTKNDWVLSLDADEQISPSLYEELRTINYEQTPCAAFKVPRLNYIFGKPIYHTNWGPKDDTHIWLFNKNHASWQGDVHEEVVTPGAVGELAGFKLHCNYQTVDQFISKMNHYTSLESKTTNPLFDFLRRYIWHAGYLDGWHGLFLSYLMFIYHLSSWIKQWHRKHTLSQPGQVGIDH